MRQPYVRPTLATYGSIGRITADLGNMALTDAIYNNTDEEQFGIPPHSSEPGDGGSRDVIIEPVP